MFTVLSPAKTLDYESPLGVLPKQTEPRFLADSETLVRLLREKSPADMANLMKVSDKIAKLNVSRFEQWRRDMSGDAARPAVFAFRGDVYSGLDIDHFNEKELRTAQLRLRILSGLYGLLRPLDRIRPYRLEMGTRLASDKGSNLYQFWGDDLTRQLAKDMAEQGSEVLVNLASQEYFKAINKKALPATIVSPVFEDEKNGNYKVISFYAKKARGLMAAWILQNDVTRLDDLTDFDVAGYAYDKAASAPEKPVFRRPEQSR